MSFTPAEIQKLGDLNYLARKKLVITVQEHDRLMDLALDLKAGTYAEWAISDIDPDAILGLMAATPDGQYGDHPALLKRFADAIGVGIKPIVRALTGWPESPAPVPQPGPEPQPGPADDLPSTDGALAQALLRITELEQRISALEQVPSPTGDVQAGVVKDLVVTGNLTVRGRTALGGTLDPNCAASLELHEGPILDGGAIQWFAGPRRTVESLSTDGGKRDKQNCFISKATVDKYDPNGDVHYKSHLQEFYEPGRVFSQIGPDSRGQLSILRIEKPEHSYNVAGKNAKHQYTQDVVLVIDEERNEATWQAWRTGMKMGLAENGKFGPIGIWTPTGGYEIRR